MFLHVHIIFLTVAVEDMLELGNRWGNLQPKVEDLLLALETNVLWPPNHAREVARWLDVLADTIVAGTLLDERVLDVECQQVAMRTGGCWIWYRK